MKVLFLVSHHHEDLENHWLEIASPPLLGFYNSVLHVKLADIKVNI